MTEITGQILIAITMFCSSHNTRDKEMSHCIVKMEKCVKQMPPQSPAKLSPYTQCVQKYAKREL